MKRVAVVIAVFLLLGIQPAASSPLLAIDGPSPDESSVNTEGSIKLKPTTESGVVKEDRDRLLVDASGRSVAGLPVNASFTFGDLGAPVDRPAFTITNSGERAREITLAYSGVTADNPRPNVRFLVYNFDGNLVTTISEESAPSRIEIEVDESLSVVVVVDTSGLTSKADLSGRFSVSL